MIWEAVVKAGLDRQCVRLSAREATREEALTCHSCEHWDALIALEHEPPATRRLWKALSAGGTGWLSGADMYFNRATPRAARLAAGGVLALTEAVCDGKLRSGFAIVRPPGHHACSDAMCGSIAKSVVAPLGSGPARLLRLPRAHLAALGSRYSQSESQPLGAQPPPRGLEQAACKVADFTAFGRLGAASVSSTRWRAVFTRTS